ncbi:MAG: hypothetical protein ACWGNV_06255, partial [Bacteroidales bacterium]
MEQHGKYESQNKWRPGIFLVLASVLFLIAGIYSGSRYRDQSHSGQDTRRFERILHQKEGLIAEEFSELAELSSTESLQMLLNGRSLRYQHMANSKGISIFYYEKGILQYWSDHSVPLPTQWRSRLSRPFMTLRNADYVTVSQTVNEGILIGLIEIRTHFPFQNDFLVNGYQHDFKLDDQVELSILEARGTEAIFNRSGAYLFSLDFTDVSQVDGGMKAMAILSLLAFAGLFFAGICQVMKRAGDRSRWSCAGVVTLLIAGAVLAVVKYAFPPILTDTDLFQPELYASRVFPSLGSLLVVTIGGLTLALIYYLYLPVAKGSSNAARRIMAMMLFAGAALLLLFIDYLIRSLVLDSGISFEIHRVTTFSVFTVIGLLVVITWFIILGLAVDRAFRLYPGSLVTALAAGSIAVTLVMIIVTLLPGDHSSWLTWIFILLLLGAFYYLRMHYREGKTSFSRFIFILFFSSVFMVIRLQEVNQVNVEQQKEVELVKLSSEHDPVAEMLFSEMSMAIRNDSVFASYLSLPYIDIDQVLERLKRNYFSGYWNKYDLQVTVCRPDDRVYIQPPDDEWQHCYTFFDRMIEENGVQIPGSDFYFLNNLNGRISYLAAIPYYRGDNEHRVFIELDSKIISEELGYPELLLDDNYTTFTSTEFSYAKYNNGKLITQEGDFPYRRYSSYYTSGEEMFERVTMDGYDHTIYNVDGQNTIIVGSPSVTLVDNLISFSYIFTFNFL